jgi:hypothetical protein
VRLIESGRAESIRRLLDEAPPPARQADAHDQGLGFTPGLIGCLARLDLPAALALIPEKGDERTINDLLGLLAHGIAAYHPGEAQRLIDRMSRNQPETYAVKTCRRMATVNLPRARRIAGRTKSDVLRGYALGRITEEFGAADCAAGLDVRPEPFRAFGTAEAWHRRRVRHRTAAVVAAALLPGVERTDPDRLVEAVDRVLALRWHPRSVPDLTMTIPDTSGVDAMRIDATLAAILARYDHELVRPIIERLKAPLSPLENQSLDRYAALPPLALSDPEATAALIEVVPDLEENGIVQSRDIARQIVAGALSEPESRFWAIIRRVGFDLDLVERDD